MPSWASGLALRLVISSQRSFSPTRPTGISSTLLYTLVLRIATLSFSHRDNANFEAHDLSLRSMRGGMKGRLLIDLLG